MWTAIVIISLASVSLTQAQCGNGAISDDMAKAVNNFSVNLFKAQVGSNQENVVICPLSVSVLLAILEQGAGGNTKRELTEVIGTDTNDSREGYCLLTKNLDEHDGNETLEFANACFLQENYTIYPEIQNIVQQDFQSEMRNVDFGDAVSAADEINGWVANKTHDRIQDLISPDALQPDTRLVLTNAIYFKDNWNSSFNSSDTTSDIFYQYNGTSGQPVPMMHKTDNYPAGTLNDLDAKWVSLPFEGDRFSMLIIVPNQKGGISGLLSGLTSDYFSDLLDTSINTLPIKVELSLPKFKLQSTMQLIPTLKQLGLIDIFSSASNLSGISGEALYVSEVIQKAEIEADEQGATASAATGVVGTTLAERIPLEVTADHPFLAFIVDGLNKVALFFCIIFNPDA